MAWKNYRRNRKWWRCRRKRYFKRKSSSHNYLSKNYGGWKDERGKYSQKGRFDWVTYYSKNK